MTRLRPAGARWGPLEHGLGGNIPVVDETTWFWIGAAGMALGALALFVAGKHRT